MVVVLVTSGELVVVLPLVVPVVLAVEAIEAEVATVNVSSTASWAPHSEQKWSVPLFIVPQNGQVIYELLSLSQSRRALHPFSQEPTDARAVATFAGPFSSSIIA